MRNVAAALIFSALLASNWAGAQGREAKAGDPWYQREKVRCIAYMDPSEFMVESVPKVRAMGFNCALVSGGASAEKLMPLIRRADEAGLRLIPTTHFNVDKYLAEHPDEPRFVGPDGVTQPVSPCPASERFWETTMGKPALELARVCGAGHPSAAGMLFDMEDYANLRDTSVGPTLYCYCDRCFGAFLKSIGKAGLSVKAPDRHGWVVENGLLDKYEKFQDDAVVGVLSGIRREIDEAAPGFMLATYPWIYSSEPQQRRSRVDWDLRFARGLGTEKAPFMILTEFTYVWGYGPGLERQRADYAARGAHFLAVAGFNVVPAERVWFPGQMAETAYWAGRRGDGYWIFLGTAPLLQAAAGQDVNYVFGGRPTEWIERFAAVNAIIASGKSMKTSPLTLPPMEQHWEMSDVYGPKRSEGADWFVRSWTDIGLPWEGGEMVLLAKKRGDWLSFHRSVSHADRYQVLLWLTTGTDRGIAQVYADDKPVGDPVDLYAPITTPGDAMDVGFIDLEGGDHTWRLEVVGKNERSTGYGIGLRAIWLEDVGYPPAEWSVMGPFDNTGENMPGYDAAYPPEKEIDLKAAYPGKHGEMVRWQEVKAQPDGYLDLLSAFSERKDAVAYCLTYVYCPTEGPRIVMLGSDDGGKLFVNGKMVWGEPVARSAERDQNEPRADFRRGWNTILFKVLQTRGRWGIYFRIEDPSHELRYSPTPPKE